MIMLQILRIRNRTQQIQMINTEQSSTHSLTITSEMSSKKLGG